MVAIVAPNVFVSKGYENEPALKFSEKGESVQFNIGWKVYDPKAENDSRWINLHVKGFGQVCERIKKMNLKESSCVNLYGRYEEDVWIDKNSGEKKKRPVIILDNIDFAYVGSKSKDGQSGGGTPQTNGYGQYAPEMSQMAPQQGYAPQAAPQGYVNQQQPQGFVQQGMPQMAKQNVPQNGTVQMPKQTAQQMASSNVQQQAPQQTAPQNIQQQTAQQTVQAPQGNNAPKPVGTAADFAGFTGFTPFEDSNMFPA